MNTQKNIIIYSAYFLLSLRLGTLRNLLFKSLFTCLIIILHHPFDPAFAQKSHPFILANEQQIDEARQKVDREPYQSMLQDIIAKEQQLTETAIGANEHSYLARIKSSIFLLTGDTARAKESFHIIKALSTDQEHILNPYSFGLTRASILRNLAMTYDFCYPVWSEDQREQVFQIVFNLMQSVTSNMGVMANYRLESNWMGIRYGSVLLSSVALNDSTSIHLGKNTEVKTHIWDAKERLRDHILKSHTPDGWFAETMGYQLYAGMFVFPALIAFQNMHEEGVVALNDYSPEVLKGFPQHITGTVSIPSGKRLGIKPDLANDNIASYITQWPLWERILPAEEQPYLRWMLRYLYQPGFSDPAEDLLYSILFHDDQKDFTNPAHGGFLTYHDPTTGVAMFRNTFKDSADIVATFVTSAKRYGGHSGPDNLSFRIMGLGNIWAVGTGRTGDPTGQTTLFPAETPDPLPNPLPNGKVVDYQANPQTGSGFIKSKGSCVGVEEHQRLFIADYTGHSGAEALFVVKDSSENGKIWRMHTPGFNTIEILPNGVLITAPNQSTMKISVPQWEKTKIEISEVRYGGKTIRHNPGVGFNKQYYLDNHLINIVCDGNITVVMTLAQPGNTHPEIEFAKDKIKVGESTISLNQESVIQE